MLLGYRICILLAVSLQLVPQCVCACEDMCSHACAGTEMNDKLSSLSVNYSNKNSAKNMTYDRGRWRRRFTHLVYLSSRV